MSIDVPQTSKQWPPIEQKSGLYMSVKNASHKPNTGKSDPTKADFIEQINLHHASLVRYAFNSTGNPTLADDLVQETYLKAWVAFHDVNDWDLFKAWINTILRRERARWFARKQFELVEFEEDIFPTKEDDTVEQDELKNLLLAEVNLLPKLYRDPMWLFINGTKCDDIAQQLELNLNTVLTRLRRARSCLLARIKV